MIRVTEILEIGSGKITCVLSNGEKRMISIQPLIEKHQHLQGIEKLNDESYFITAEIGDCGEIFWKNTITNSRSEKWNYDLSPEFIEHCAEPVS